MLSDFVVNTPAAGDSSTKIANTQFISSAIVASTVGTSFVNAAIATALSTAAPPSISTAWTPVLLFNGSSGGGITYSSQTGLYVQIGAYVFGSFSFTLSSKGTTVGTATIATLPVAMSSNSNGAVVISNYIALNSVFTPAGYITTTVITLTNTNTTVSNAAIMSNSNFTNTSQVYGTFSYLSA